MRFSTSAALTAIAALAPSVASAGNPQGRQAVLHFFGNGPLVTTRVDPIVNPGEPASHEHAVMGGNAFAMNMPGDAATKATCTNTRIKNDNSNYWTPTLYFTNPDGSFTPVEMFYMNVYYKFDKTNDKLVAFPPGLRMLSGNPLLRAPPATGANLIIDNSDGTPQPVQWTCPRSNTNEPLYPTNSDGTKGVGIGDQNNHGAGVGFPDQNCDGYASPLRADIHFPSCYNPAAGPDAYETNMAFPTNGDCPSGWLHTPHLFYEVYWNTPKFADKWTPGQGKQPFVLSNGDPTGYSLHGDFINGWDTNTLQTIVDTCDASVAGMDKCPQIPGGLTDTSTECHITSPVDDVTGSMTQPIQQLPGCNPIQHGPALAVKQTSNCGGVIGGDSVSPAAKASSSASIPTTAAPTKVSKPTTTSVTQPATTPVYQSQIAHTTLKTVISSPPAMGTTAYGSTMTKTHVHHRTHTHTHHRYTKRVAMPTAGSEPVPRYRARR